jgi:hypothetical protein
MAVVLLGKRNDDEVYRIANDFKNNGCYLRELLNDNYSGD